MVYEFFYQNYSAVITFVINAVCWFLTILLYGVAGVLSFKRAKKSLTRRQRTNLRRELKLFKQALIITVVTSIFLILQFFPDCSSFACKMSAYGAILAYGMAAPVSYLIIDKTLRTYMMKMLFCRKEDTMTMNISTIAVPKERNGKTTLA
uniref:7TM GPCR serpentine receptor class x (Srx) domain-containing protein n=1 Tax=Romanomermis culicivorax TaxID=13658 RepID=A0A915L0Z3_ROMCU